MCWLISDISESVLFTEVSRLFLYDWTVTDAFLTDRGMDGIVIFA